MPGSSSRVTGALATLIAFNRLVVSVTLIEGVDVGLGAVQFDVELVPVTPVLVGSVLPLVLGVVDDVAPLLVDEVVSTVPELVVVRVAVEVLAFVEVELLVVVVLRVVVVPLAVGVVMSIVPELVVEVTRSPELVDVVPLDLTEAPVD